MLNERLKGGVGGSSTRIHEHFKVKTPSVAALAKHTVFYSDKDLYLGDIELVPSPEKLFGNTNPIHLDLGCGRGEYVISLAEQNPQKNFVGVDYHSKSLYVGINAAVDKKLHNVKFIRADIRNLMPHIPDETVRVCSILFPAPVLNERKFNRELVREPLVRHVYRVLSENDIFVFVSDAREYFDHKLTMINDLQLFTLRLVSGSLEVPITRYQKLWQSKGILSNRAEFIKKG